jgi:DNA-binding transcriptional ArsR family regulator
MKLMDGDRIPLHMYILRYLFEAGHASNGDICDEFDVSAGTVSCAFKILEDGRLLDRVYVGKSVLVSLSPRGIVLMDMLAGLHPHSVYTPADVPEST